MNECLRTLNRAKLLTLIDGGSVGAVNVRTKVSTLIDHESVGAVNVRTKVSTLIDGGSVGALNVRTKVSTLIDQRPQWGCGSWCHLWIQGNPWNCKHRVHGRNEGNVLFNDTLNTFYLQLYHVIHMVKDY